MLNTNGYKSLMHFKDVLTPTTFLERTGRVFPNKTAIVEGKDIITYGTLLSRARCLADLLDSLNIRYGDRVAVLAENCLTVIDAHFGIPAIGAILVMLNPSLTSSEIEYLLDFSGASILILDANFSHKVLPECQLRLKHLKNIIIFNGTCDLDNAIDYEKYIDRQHKSNRELDKVIRDENDILTINFTSGTTGSPKGVMCSHRGAYLHSLGQILMLGLNPQSRYLWTLPMFHVNGWGHIWASTAISATQIIYSSYSKEEEILSLLHQYSITHLCGAPRIVRKLIKQVSENQKYTELTITTGGATPPPSLIQELIKIGVRFIHQYGLSETYGPFIVCEKQEEWDKMPFDRQAKFLLRQGVPCIHAGTGMRVVDKDMRDVPKDGHTLGEVIMKGNTVSTGYFKNQEATEQAFRNGWFHSGDIAVVHLDGYIEIRDRIKDLIYVETDHGWENISSIEIENFLSSHKYVNEAAVIGIPTKNTSRIIAFVEIANNLSVNEKDLKEFCNKGLPEYKCPEAFYFKTLPKTSTGKIRKNILLADILPDTLERTLC